MWEDNDKLEVIITPRYLNELTWLSWEVFKEKGKREIEKEGDLREICFFLELMVRWQGLIPWSNEIDVLFLIKTNGI